MTKPFEQRKNKIKVFSKLRKKKVSRESRDIPDNVFINCPKCGEGTPSAALMQDRYVCPACGYHYKLSARERLRQILDEKSFSEINKDIETIDPESFAGYAEKLDRYQRQTGMSEAILTGTGKIDGRKVAIGVMDSRFMMASMGSAVGEKVTLLMEIATRKKLPLILFCTSGGARMQEGIVSLIQMVKTSAAAQRFSEAGGLYISVLTNPTTGGVSASFAMLGDILIAEPEALIGFAGKRVIESTIHQQLPKEFQTSEFLLEKGGIDAIVPRDQMRETLIYLLRIHERKSK